MKIEIVGTAPLLMHNVRLADAENPYVKEISKLTAKRTRKTDEDRREIDRLSFAGGLYHDAQMGPYLPAENIFRCLQESAALTRSGKKIERGVIFLESRVPIEYEGPRDIDSLWNDGNSQFVDRRMVVVQRQRIARVRPIFPEWQCSISVEIDRQIIDPDEFCEITAKAGRLIGLGDFRRFYGKFNGTVIR